MNPGVFLSTCLLFIFKIILPNHIFDYHPIPEKKQIGEGAWDQDMKFEGVLKKASRNSRID